KKLAGAPLRVVARAARPRAFDEPHMAAALRDLQVEGRRSTGDGPHLFKNIGRQKRVVDRAEEKGRQANSIEKAERAGATVVVVRVGETVNGRRHGPVELEDVGRGVESRGVEQPRISLQLAACLDAKRLEKMAVVDAREALRDMARSALEIERNGESRRRFDLRR